MTTIILPCNDTKTLEAFICDSVSVGRDGICEIIGGDNDKLQVHANGACLLEVYDRKDYKGYKFGRLFRVGEKPRQMSLFEDK